MLGQESFVPELLFPNIDSNQPVVEIVSPGKGGLKWLTVRRIRLSEASPEATIDLAGEEAVLDIFGGLCSVNIRSKAGNAVFPEVGGRKNVFSGKPHMIYL